MGKRDGGGGGGGGNHKFSDMRDDYRKKIGKQDYLKSKSHLKKSKMVAEIKQSGQHYKDMMLVIGTVASVVLGIYAMFYSMARPK